MVPRLRSRQRESWRGLVMRPGSDPLFALARALGGEIDQDTNEDERVLRARSRSEMLLSRDVRLSDLLTAAVDLRYASFPPRLNSLYLSISGKNYIRLAKIMNDGRHFYRSYRMHAASARTS